MIENNVIAGNYALENCGGVYWYDCNVTAVNNTICENSAGYWSGGLAGIGYGVITNNVIWGNWDPYGDAQLGGDNLDVSYCDIQDTLWPGEGNISVDPLFRDPDNGDFHLMSTSCGDPYDSPCIDVGDPSIFDYLVDCNWGLGAPRSDMGAYGGQAIPTDTEEERESEIPISCGLSQNYPNPFNATTSIRYHLSSTCNVRIDVYDLLGRLVSTLTDERQSAGYHRVRWDAGHLPSGIYFYRVAAGEYIYSGSCLLLK